MDIDELARITQEQFSQQDKRFNEIDQRFDKLEAGQKQILEILLDTSSGKVIDQVSHRVDDHEDRIGAIERKLQPVA